MKSTVWFKMTPDSKLEKIIFNSKPTADGINEYFNRVCGGVWKWWFESPPTVSKKALKPYLIKYDSMHSSCLEQSNIVKLVYGTSYSDAIRTLRIALGHNNTEILRATNLTIEPNEYEVDCK